MGAQSYYGSNKECIIIEVSLPNWLMLLGELIYISNIIGLLLTRSEMYHFMTVMLKRERFSFQIEHD